MSDTPNPKTNPWANDQRLLDLYRRRCRRQVEEMTCAAQAAEILAPLVRPSETLLDAGCGAGYYYWSFQSRGVPVEYVGLDYTPEMISVAREEMCSRAGLEPGRFLLGSIDHLDGTFDNILCFNVLTNNPHYAQPLERILEGARKRVLLRESLGDELRVAYTPDPYLDEGRRHIRVYHNTYPLREVVAFIQGFGYTVTCIPDRRTQDAPEMVVDVPHFWRILLAERR